MLVALVAFRWQVLSGGPIGHYDCYLWAPSTRARVARQITRPFHLNFLLNDSQLLTCMIELIKR